MNIGIIGTGNMGSGLGKAWAAKGHKILLGSRDPQKAKTLAKTMALNISGGSIAEAAAFGEVVLLATPWTAATDAIKAAGPLGGKILIDCTNPLTPDMRGLTLGHTTSAGEVVAKWAPEAKVVKAFNHIFAQIVHSSPQFGGQSASVFYCGNDPGAKATVAGLAKEIGFEPIDAGPLQNARVLEPLGLLCIQLAYGLAMGTDVAMKLIRR